MKDNRTSVKRSLITSAVALVLTAALLIGTTFAWFTDSASSGVNKIQAGNLDVDLQMNTGTADSPSWVTAEGMTLEWKTADNRSQDEILWEPGCTYEMPQLRVVNKGKLALKYKVVITGINGSAKLNKVIGWTINDTPINLAETSLAANTQGDAFTIKGHMQETAGNEYEGLSIGGISITVVAKQDTVEKDSIDNQYDKDAIYDPYPVEATSLEAAFPDAGVDFTYGNSTSGDIVLDGHGTTTITEWTDAWFNSNTTIKGVTFKNGAVFNANNDNVTLTLEDCVFEACDQSTITATNKVNSGQGMCLDVESRGKSNVTFNILNCTSVGENSFDTPFTGDKFETTYREQP